MASAYPGRQVVALSGDGGVEMLLGELLTLVQNKLPVKVVVFNNSLAELRRTGDEGQRFRDHGDRPGESRPGRHRPAAGDQGLPCRQLHNLEQVLAEAFAYDGPALIDVVTERW